MNRITKFEYVQLVNARAKQLCEAGHEPDTAHAVAEQELLQSTPDAPFPLICKREMPSGEINDVIVHGGMWFGTPSSLNKNVYNK